MNNGKINSNHGSVIQSRVKRQPAGRNASEQEFLAEQTADARAAIRRTLHDLSESVRRVADVRSTAKHHPWITVGAAAMAGFVASAMLTSPAKPIGNESTSAGEGDSKSQPATPSKKSLLLTTIISVLTGVMHSVVQTAITSAAGGIAEPTDQRSADESSQPNDPAAPAE